MRVAGWHAAVSGTRRRVTSRVSRNLCIFMRDLEFGDGARAAARRQAVQPPGPKLESQNSKQPAVRPPTFGVPNSLSCVRATGFLHQPNVRHHLARGCQSWPSSGVRRRPAGPPHTCLGGGLYKSWPARSASSSFRAAVTVRGLGSRPANSAGKSRQATLSCTRRANM